MSQDEAQMTSVDNERKRLVTLPYHRGPTSMKRRVDHVEVMCVRWRMMTVCEKIMYLQLRDEEGSAANTEGDEAKDELIASLGVDNPYHKPGPSSSNVKVTNGGRKC